MTTSNTGKIDSDSHLGGIDSSRIAAQRVWAVPLAMLTVMVGLTAVVWRLERSQERAAIDSATAIYRVQFDKRIEVLINDRFRPLRRRWVSSLLATPSTFGREAQQVLNESPSLMMLGWVDEKGVCREIVGSASDAPRIGQHVDEHWGELVERSHNGTARGGVISPPWNDPMAGPVFRGALPGTQDRFDNTFSPGGILFEYRVQTMFDGFNDPAFNGNFILELSDGGVPVFTLPPHRGGGDWVLSDAPAEPVSIMDRLWTLRLSPTETYVQQHVASLPSWALLCWLAGSLLLIFSTYQAILYRRANDARINHYLHALETVTETSAEILSKVGSTGEVWQQLPRVARSLTSMSMASVGVIEEGCLRIVADSAVEPSQVGQRFPLEQIPTVLRCVQTAQPVTVSDINLNQVPVNRQLAGRYGLRSLLQVPLIVGDTVIGVMMLGSQQPRAFSEQDLRLAALWGMLAGVTIANERLYERMSEALSVRDKLLGQRDALFEVDATIARHGSLEEILQRIADLAPAPLGVDLCQVILLAESGKELVVKATTKQYNDRVKGFRYDVEGTNSGQAITTGKTIVVEDGPQNKTLQPFLRTQLPCGSVVYVPLMGSSGKPMGLLVFLRELSGTFSAEQLNLMQLFATQAAAAIENAQLYQQIHRDSEAKAMLLRELTHRVKNNLAGIVSLLAIDQPDVSPRAQQWLDRVVDRIRTMARAHEMLSGGLERAPIRELVDQTLRSLAVVTPSGVLARSDIPQPGVSLRTERAVSLAMVLHELCYNAVVHGLSDQGLLLVRAVVDGKNEMTMEVIDNGRGFPTGNSRTVSSTAGDEIAADAPAGSDGEPHAIPESATGKSVADRSGVATARRASAERASAARGRAEILSAERSGLGLNLVRDFVSRELRGQFSIVSNPGAGTIARVVFPLLEDELPDKV